MSDENAIARHYDESKNPEGRTLLGVPLRDLTIGEWQELPEWVQRSIDAAGFYTIPKGAPKVATAGPPQE